MRQSLFALVVVLTLGPLPGRAADLAVVYTVDEKALKAAIAGTNLTFNLYADGACDGPSVNTEALPIESVDVISRLSVFVPRGAAKGPKTDELRHTLAGVDTTSSLYLQVTGTGIKAVGRPCQLQWSASEQAPYWEDAHGTFVGHAHLDTAILMKDGSHHAVRVETDGSGNLRQAKLFDGVAPLYFASANCDGPALMAATVPLAPARGAVVDTLVYYPSAIPASPVPIGSILSVDPTIGGQGDCDSIAYPGDATFVPPQGCCSVNAFPLSRFLTRPAMTLDMSGFVQPFQRIVP